MWYVAEASEYLVITGLFIKDIKIAKKAWVLVGQKCGRINVKPVAYEFQIGARSSEKLEFVLPANYTIGPDSKNIDALRRYAQLVAPRDEGHQQQVIETIRPIVEGQTRALAANMAMEEIFKGTEEFQRQVKQLVQRELEPFGLVVYTANVLQLLDVEGHPYLSYLGMKAEKDAENKAKVDVARATYAGDTGAKDQEGKRERELARVEAETAKYKAERMGEVERKKAEVEAETKVRVTEKKAMGATAENELEVKKAKLEQETALAKVEAEKAAELREAEMRREVERMRGLAATEKSRAEVVTRSLIAREASEESARAEQYRKEREAEAGLFKRKAELEARQEAAKAAAFARRQAAEARVSEGEAEAEVRKRKAKAIAYSIRTVSWAVLHVILALCLSYQLIGFLGTVRRSTPHSPLIPPNFPNYVFTPKAIFNLLLTGDANPSLPAPQPDPSSLPNPIALDNPSPPPSIPSHPLSPNSPTHDPQTSNNASIPSHPLSPNSPTHDPQTSNNASEPPIIVEDNSMPSNS